MAEVTVKHLAESVGTATDKILQQMQEAGLPQKNVDDQVTEDQKKKLLSYLKRTHGETESQPTKITLKRRTQSTLKSSGSAGRGRTVNVEVRKKRTYVRKGEAEKNAEAAEAAKAVPEVAKAKPREDDAEYLRQEAARKTAEQAGLKEKQEAERKAKEEQERLALEQAEKEKAEQEQEKKKAEAEKEGASKTPAKPKEGDKADDLEANKISARKDKRDRHDLDDDDGGKSKKTRQSRRKKLDYVDEIVVEEVAEIIEEIVEEAPEQESSTLGLAVGARAKRKPKKAKAANKRHVFTAPTEEVTREVEIGETITVSQLSQKMSVKARDVIKALMNMEIMVNINESVDQETAKMLVEEFGHKVKILDADAIEKSLEEDLQNVEKGESRAPVITVMGHVDHGKTSLLDSIRKSDVVDNEEGGITQHIGAYRVNTSHGEICFIDTPGHAAFTAMRARGANCTDIVILVVAADDGVMPQTEEAILHAKAANAPIVVAINKMDKEGADVDRVKNELAAKEVIPEDWGGDTQFIPVSALKGEGIDDLLEAVLLQAEILELKARPDGPAQGVVIESELDKGKGAIATLLVQQGQLKQGDVVVAGQNYGRVRALSDESGQKIKSAGPSTPVSVLGLNGTPGAGASFIVTKNEKKAREVAEHRTDRAESERLSTPTVNLENLIESFGAEQVNYLNIVLKTDVRGSLEAIVTALKEIGNEEVQVNVVFSGVGGITESDVNYAMTSGAVIFGFNVRADNAAKKLIAAEELDLRYYKVIYDLVDDVKAALKGMLSPELREEIVGIAEVRDVFRSKKFGQIAGCMVIEGTVSKSKKIRVLRDNVVIFEGDLESLRHFKEEVSDVRNGTECGIGVKNYDDVKAGDLIEVFDSKEVAREL